MDPTAVIIQQPDIRWMQFITACQASIGRSPTRSLDVARIQPGLPASFVQALGEFQHSDTAPLPFLKSRQADLILEHISYTFLLAADEAVMRELLKLGKLKLLFAENSNVAVGTGNLIDWKSTIVHGCHPKALKGLRELINRVQHQFSIIGMSWLWQDTLRQATSDGTVALLPR